MHVAGILWVITRKMTQFRRDLKRKNRFEHYAIINSHLAMTGIHRASSNSWQDQAYARLCEVVMEANDGMAQQIQENKTDLLDMMSVEDLSRPDDLGLTLPFLAVYYDRPDMLVYLRKRGVDLNAPCDPLAFGNLMFYAVALRRHEVVRTLDLLGISSTEPMTQYNETAMQYASRTNDELMRQTLHWSSQKEIRAYNMFMKHYLRRVYRAKYLKMKVAARLLQRIIRGFLGRRKALRRRKRLEREAQEAAAASKEKERRKTLLRRK